TPHREADTKQLKTWAGQLRTVKKSEALCGLRLERNDPIVSDGTKLIHTVEETFQTLLPLYKGAF
ncbi:MAG: DUF1054 family protein, partial [Paenibacillus sp.]